MINNKVYRYQRVNFVWVAAKFAHSIPHAREINNCWDTSEILEEDTGWLERDFDLLWCAVLPVYDLLNVLPRDLELITVSDCRLEKNPYRVGEPINPRIGERRQAVVLPKLRSAPRLREARQDFIVRVPGRRGGEAALEDGGGGR